MAKSALIGSGCSRKIESRFIESAYKRIGYRGTALSFVFPLDASLNLPPEKYSHVLPEEVAHLVAVESFDETLESLERQGRGILPKRQLQDVSWELLKGNVQNVASGLRRAATRRELNKKERKPVDTAANYIENNQERLKYNESLEQGFPIATGVIEGACRHLVKDRMDLIGARW